MGRHPGAPEQRHRDWLMYDFGQATQNMMLAAADLGIGTGHSAVIDQEQARRVLGFPDGCCAVYLIGLGYPSMAIGAPRPGCLAPGCSRQCRPPAEGHRSAALAWPVSPVRLAGAIAWRWP